MFAISNRYLFKPPSRMVSWKRGSWVRGTAGRYYDPVKVFLLDSLDHLFLRVGGTGIEVLFGMDHIRNGFGIFNDCGDIHHTSDIGTAAADKDADSRFLFGDLGLRRVDFFSDQSAASFLDQTDRPGRLPRWRS